MSRFLTDDAWQASRRPLRDATGLPPDAYASPEFFAVEQSRVFGRSWVCVGIAEEVRDPGRLLVRTVATTSVLVTRDADGVLRGFRNSCRHRGTELAHEDCDIAGTIRCPYHRWGYGLDGTLVATPRFEEVPRTAFDRADFGLVPVQVETWGVLLFVCLDAETPPLRQWLGDLPERFAGYGLDRWELREQSTVTIEANWKLISENFQEYYHLTWVHPELAKVSRVDDHYRFQGPGMYCGQTTTPVSNDSRDDWLVLPRAPDLDESDGGSGRFIALFPNVLLSVLPNHAFVMWLDPQAPGRTLEHWAFLLPPSTTAMSPAVSDADFDATRSFWLAINQQDIGIVQRGQRGLAHGSVAAGPLAPRFEEPLHRFHNMLADLMTVDSIAELVTPVGDDRDTADLLGTGVNPFPAKIDRP